MRTPAVAGLVFVVLVVASGAVAHAPAADAPADEVALAFSDDATRHAASAFLIGLAGLAALAFAAGLASLAANRGRAGDALARGVVTAAATAVALVLTGRAAHAALAVVDDPSPSAVAALFGVGNVLFAFAWFPLALLAAAASLGTSSAGVGGRWLGPAGIAVAALFLAVPPDTLFGVGVPAVVGLLVLLAWVVVVSVTLLAGATRRRPAPASRAGGPETRR